MVAKSWWDGQFHKTRMEGGPRGAIESWRSIDAGLMVVKTSLKLKEGKEVSMVWYLEEMTVPGENCQTPPSGNCLHVSRK